VRDGALMGDHTHAPAYARARPGRRGSWRPGRARRSRPSCGLPSLSMRIPVRTC